MNSNKPLLSFCIPTYNHVNLVLRCVHNILEYKGDDIEVVVSDNYSEDDTLEKLALIKDARLKVFSNDVNTGFVNNFIKVLVKANGKYCMYLNTRDIVLLEKIPSLLDLLTKMEYDLILPSIIWYDHGQPQNTSNYYTSYHKNQLNKLYTIKKILTRRHPTGFTVKREKIDSHKLLSNNQEYYDVYPHVYIPLMVNEGGKTFFSKDAYVAITKNPYASHVIEDNIKANQKPYAHPRSRFSQMKKMIQWIEELKLNPDERKTLLLFLFQNFLWLSVYGYETYVSDEEKKVSGKRLNLISWEFGLYVKFTYHIINDYEKYKQNIIKNGEKLLKKIIA